MRRMTGRNNRRSNAWTGKQVFGGLSRCQWASTRVETFGTGGTSWPTECNQGTEGHCAPEVRAKLTASMQPSTAQHRPHSPSPAQHITEKCATRPVHLDTTRSCGMQICQPCQLGTYPPDLKGCGLSRTWQHIEGGPRRNRRRSALRVSVNVRLPRP